MTANFFKERAHQIDVVKEAGGGSWIASTQVHGGGGRVSVRGLTREQANQVDALVREVQRGTIINTQDHVRRALGLSN